MRLVTLTAALLAAVAVAGCSVSPQPEPVLGKVPDLDTDLISLASSGAATVIAGEPGAVDPAPGSLTAVNLTVGGEPVAGAIAVDGSFEVTVPGVPTDVYRLEALVEGYRSSPFEITSEGGVTRWLNEPADGGVSDGG